MNTAICKYCGNEIFKQKLNIGGSVWLHTEDNSIWCHETRADPLEE